AGTHGVVAAQVLLDRGGFGPGFHHHKIGSQDSLGPPRRGRRKSSGFVTQFRIGYTAWLRPGGPIPSTPAWPESRKYCPPAHPASGLTHPHVADHARAPPTRSFPASPVGACRVPEFRLTPHPALPGHRLRR